MPTNEGFTVHDGNPNDKFGGGGCLVGGAIANEDCEGKWVNFFRVQTEDAASPYATICEKHLHLVTGIYEDDDVQHETDALALRQRKPITREDTGLPVAPFAGNPGFVEV